MQLSLSARWDNFVANPYIDSDAFNETLFNELLHKSMDHVISSEEQFDSLHELFENSKAEHAKLKIEKKQIEDKGGRKKRTIQEELRLKQVNKVIYSTKMRYKRQGNKMRRSQKFALTLTDKLQKLLCALSTHPLIQRIHFLLISFCVNTLSEMHNKFASNQQNIQQIYNFLLQKKHQTKALFTSLLKWIHSYTDDPVNIIKIFNINNGDNKSVNIWILYIICCAFPALFITISINTLQHKPSLNVLLHHCLPKYPLITLQIINSCVNQENGDINQLKMLLKICQFHPLLWNKIQTQQFAKNIFNLLVASNDDLLFNFEGLMIDNHKLSVEYAKYLSDVIINLDDFDKYINSNILINNQCNASQMLSLCNKFKSLKQCNFHSLIKQQNIIKLLCLMDKSFFFKVLIKLIINYGNIQSYLQIFDADKFCQIIETDIDIIAYYSLKQSDSRNNAFCIKNLCVLCDKFKVKFVVNTFLISQIYDLLTNINMDIVALFNHINIEKIPKNVGIILCNYCFTALIASENNRDFENGLIELILKLCKYDKRVSKEPIELCISYILCPQLNGEKISKLKSNRIKNKKQKHTKTLTPKIRINPYATALLKQIDKENVHKFDALKKIIHENNTKKQEFKQEDNNNNNAMPKNEKEAKTYELCWYLLSKLCVFYVPYLSEFIQQILPGIHLEPSQSRYTESVQKGTVLMFDHDILVLFEAYPDLLLIIKLFCVHSKLSENNSTHNDILVYLRSLCVSYYIKCTKYTKALKVNGKKCMARNRNRNRDRKEEYDQFYGVCNVLFECIYLSEKISLKFYKMVGLLFDLDLNEIGKLFRHICNLCLQPQQNQIVAKSAPSFPLKLNQKMLETEKRVIRQILLQNTDLMSKHVVFVASILSK